MLGLGLGLNKIRGVAPLVAWTPAQITTSLWLDAADASTITESGGAVSQWDDKSGANRNVTQASGANQPMTGTTSLNGLNALDFDGTDDFLSLAYDADISSINKNIFIVAVPDGGAGGFRSPMTNRQESPLYGYYCYANATNKYEISIGNGSWTSHYSTVDATLGTGVIMASQIATGSFVSWINGSQIGSSSSTMVPAVADLKIGRGNSAFAWNGRIAEVLISDGVLSNEDRQKLEGYLAHKWGLTDSLPVGHPYKTNPPKV